MTDKGLPSVSIVIPSYNVGRFLDTTLESIVNQTFTDWECIIVDDGSKDDSVEIARRWAARDPRFKAVTQTNAGPSRARNHGYGLISPSSRYVTFMDADDVWTPDALETLHTDLEQHPAAVGTHGLADMIDEQGKPHYPGSFILFGRERIGYRDGKIVPWPADAPTTFETLIHIGRVYPPGVLLTRREVYDCIGAWDSELAATQDWDMVVRVSRHGPIRFMSQVVLYYRKYPGSVSTDSNRTIRETRLQHYKIFFSPDNTPEQRAIVRNGWKAWQVYKIHEKSRQMREALTHGRPWEALIKLGHVGVHVFRYVRGYPTPRGV
ncbi:MAG: glycosyl transferase family 2 [Chthonomonadaceae bacterium]|nr:glycosyl transferase family 2 [Chthonomonadaceae bacterium]